MDERLLYFVLSLSSIIFLILLVKLLNRTKPNLPPSPPSLPIIGHLHLLKQPIHRTLQNLSDRYGPVISLSFGSKPVVVVSSPSGVDECFVKNDIVFANRVHSLAGKHLGYNNTVIGTSSYGPHWRNLRRLMVLELLSPHRLNSFFNIRKEEIVLLVKNLQHGSRDHGNGFVRVEMRPRLQELTFNVIMRMVSGKRYFGTHVDGGDAEEARRFRETITEIFELSGTADPGDFLPVLSLVDFTGNEKRMLRVKKVADEILQGLVDERRKIRDGGELETKTMIDTVLSLQDSEPEYYTDDIIKGLILTLLSAGTDTSAVTIEWAMSLLLNDPSVLKKARDELDNVIGHERLADESDFQNLPYLQNVVNEALRLFPPAPLLIPHKSSEDTTIGGYHIPAGTMLLVNAWAIHRDPKVWDDPTSFRPERHEGLGSDHSAAYKLLPFGLGRRGCPGIGLAHKVVGCALAVLIQCFEWERISEEAVDLSEGFGLTMPKVHPLEALCKARKPMLNVLAQH